MMSAALPDPSGAAGATPQGDYLLQALIDASPYPITYCEAVWQADPHEQPRLLDFSIRLGNQALYTFMGQPAERVLEGSLSRLAPSLMAPDLLACYAEVMQTRTARQIEWAYPDRGLTSWYLLQVSPMVAGLMLTLTEVTALKQKETHLQALIDQAHTGITLIRPVREEPVNTKQKSPITDFEITLVNQAQARYLGQTPQTLVGTLASQYFTAYKEMGLFARYCQVVETGIAQRFEQHYTGDGVDVWVDIQATLLEDQVLITFSDHSVLKQTQLRLEEQTRLLTEALEGQQQTSLLLQSVLNSSPTSIRLLRAVRQETGDIIDFVLELGNEASPYRPDGLAQGTQGRRLLAVYPQLKATGLFDRFVQVVETHEPSRFETPFFTNDSAGWYACTAVPQDDGLVLTTLDITAGRQAQLDQQHAASLLQSVLDASVTGMVLVDSVRDEKERIVDFRFRLANQAFLQAARRSAQQLMGQSLLAQHPHLLGSDVLEQYVAVVESGQPQQLEQVMPTREGQRWLSVAVFPHGDGLVISFTDITPLKQTQQKLEEAIDALKQSNQNLQQFAYVASHDLQEPLRKIQQFGNLLKTHSQGRDEELGYLDRMQLAASRMSMLIRDLLDYSRLTPQREHITPVSLHEVVHQVLTTLELVILEAGATVQVDALPIIRGDATQLNQLFQNLLSNALKFRRTDVAPVIEIRAIELEADQLPAGVKPSHKARAYHLIEVRDNGIGFDEAYRDRIFEVFQRLHGKTQYAGTGIGLAICQKVAANHGGAITARSQPGTGATFSVYLPAG